ncbi:hypothetical protein H6F78_06775 [Coleofasciculus sp. FACHB-64]|uniref:hypothetical protein n=1 Tax=Cyanophyceae TaxID=3028117 RepID=UPI001687C8C7|nr:MULTISPECIES: hypothetical protein [unclassified Coleofasciculus]MBD1840741.1 hypothetical protein [Coleofasciculus sp. FACHB-501]MBD1902562.1 hypothetical protein [Coleofasciculus sp. FACHB-125]MBD2045300.1 hypothetical protein [Coleofasciculus sp. FACHB-64]MBD2083383.1 hypothetical protein [Coleofasciculus sp. FACHB-542]MBD2538537.1 hypothetical protein [Coleofasciculus sp. FACHB-SPT36]
MADKVSRCTDSVYTVLAQGIGRVQCWLYPGVVVTPTRQTKRSRMHSDALFVPPLGHPNILKPS